MQPLPRLLLSAAFTRVLQRWIKVAERAEVLAKVQEILVERLDVDPADINEAAHMRDDLQADSLDLVELIMDLEEGFGVKISDEEAQSIGTVGDAVDFIVARAD